MVAPVPSLSYERRRPEESVLYKAVRRHWPTIQAELREAQDGEDPPKFLVKAVQAYEKCGILKFGFCRVYCADCRKDQLVAWSCKARGICPSCDGRRMTELAAHLVDSVIAAVPVRQFVLTLPFALHPVLAWNAAFRQQVLSALMRALQAHYRRQARAQGLQDPKFAAFSVLQRWNGALRIFPHWHILAADGTWQQTAAGRRFVPAPSLTEDQLSALLQDAVARILRQVRKLQVKKLQEPRGDGADAAYPFAGADPALAALLRNSLFGRHELERTLRVVPGQPLPAPRVDSKNCQSFEGFSLHANTRIHEVAREKLEHLFRYICRPAIAAPRIEAIGGGKVRIHLKNEWKGGIRAVVMAEEELVRRIIAQIPLPRRASLHYFGLWAPASVQRAEVVPVRGRLAKLRVGRKAAKDRAKTQSANEDAPPDERAVDTRLKWCDCLKRAFFVDILACSCGGRRKVLAAVTDLAQAEKILRHVGLWQTIADDSDIVAIRGPPEVDLWPPDDVPPSDFDAVDEPGAADWAA